MIVCSCNRLSDGDVRACLRPGPECPRTPAQVYHCLGCRPNCGRCATTIRAIMDKSLAQAAGLAEGACARGCCPSRPADLSPALADGLAA